MIKITLSNKKLGGTTPQISLPAGLTCRKNAPCAKGCYARKGTFTYNNVKESHKINISEFMTSPKDYFSQIVDYLQNGDIIYKYFRWHVSGDIVNMDYLKGMIETAKKCKSTKFLAFTKRFEIVNEYLDNGGKIPSNLKIVFSNWGKLLQCNNPYNLPTTDLIFKKEILNAKAPKNAYVCSGDCKNCRVCWNLKKGQTILFHEH